MIYHGINYYNLLPEYKPEQKRVNAHNYKIRKYDEPPKGWKRFWAFLT